MSTTLTENLTPFIQQSKLLFQEGSEKASALPANTVQVWPGGAQFSTIQAAINSITNASPQVQYQVSIGPGTYSENVTMKDYVYLMGAGETATTITAPGQPNFGAGVVNSASNCGISDLAIVATGGEWGTCPVGIKIVSSGKFHVSDVTITSSDSNIPGNNVRGISNNTGSYEGYLILGDTTINVSGVNDSVSVGVEGFGTPGSATSLTMYIDICTISSTTGYGVSLAVAASATLDNSSISGPVYALNNSDGMSPITANQCTIVGPVSAGVIVNN
jgi:hypothetical protein